MDVGAAFREHDAGFSAQDDAELDLELVGGLRAKALCHGL